jgi:hypothetical protein
MEVEDQEYWGTFSIYDHRTPLYRQSLVLFDKVVIPVPVRPIKGSAGEITAEEIKRLSADVDYLRGEGAAVRVDWNPKDFNHWRESQAGEALAQLLDKDKQLATRFQLQEAVEKGLLSEGVVKRVGPNEDPGGTGLAAVKRIRAIPVYGDWQEYLAVWKSGADTKFVEIVAEQIPMPADESPLEAIVELRQRDSFKYFVKAFRHFQEQTVINLLNAHGDPEIIKRASEAASSMLADWVGKFRKDVEDLRVKRVEGSFAWLLAVSSALYDWTGLSLKALAELVPHAFKIRSLTRPWWTVVTDKPWAAAGLVYESLEAVKRS